jgi:arabinan endo-1,5-alpha-L-arabinosidase
MAKQLSRRLFLRATILTATGLSAAGLPALAAPLLRRKQDTPMSTLELSGRLKQVHDPVIAKDGERYFLFSTGNGIAARYSDDMLHWETTFPPNVFVRVPAWALEMVPGATNMWAPDISYFNDRYHLYYSVSTFGSNRSVIGLVTNVTLDRENEGFEWVDQGLVVESQSGGNHNAIDANLILDENEVPWLAFGSFWGGIKMRRLDYETGKPSAEDETLYALATRDENSRSVEAPFIIRRNGYYYLFVSFDFCCRGIDSTYRVMVGRSENVTGPYVDRDGVPMMEGGGTQVTFPTERWRGPGHNAIFSEDGVDYIIYHAYDAESQGVPTLRIDKLTWDDDGWPAILG